MYAKAKLTCFEVLASLGHISSKLCLPLLLSPAWGEVGEEGDMLNRGLKDRKMILDSVAVGVSFVLPLHEETRCTDAEWNKTNRRSGARFDVSIIVFI